ncbi:hypothetical protein K402DRAFT_407008 [Aulographum hederae CBS 113979]|uniref:DUF2415 domain-containing protein n=1 Tax=Aulographum hederae CBS 113979 TaxID=1176131 RepID=A0A6G1GR88_9PEZI|nr:hypothetical protein K402DRAFT_407008 [Aulographum hederae CBS 113979]
MTVDPFCCLETGAFVQPTKSFYAFDIPVEHWQLRHNISSSQPDVLYFASESNLFSLNTATKTRTLVATLPFKIRCTASGYGWICAGGGEQGQFAVVKLDGTSCPAAEVDATLPLEFNSRDAGRPHSASPKVKIEDISSDIINSISVHCLWPLDRSGATDPEVVALFTSNDKTVRIYSLTYDRDAVILDLPFAINHATISPDGQMLVAVGDFNQAYFYERLISEDPLDNKPNERSQTIRTTFENINILRLHVPRDSKTFGYFSTAWSPSGRVCAVASECGYITLYDTTRIKSAEVADDAIIDIVGSSRPDGQPGPGSVRSMIFSPQPWDFLIWAEDHGRVCIADLREGAKVRQVLHLDLEDPSLYKVDVEDYANSLQSELRILDQDADFIRRYRRALDADNATMGTNLSGRLREGATERRLQRMLSGGPHENEPHGLTHEERQILETLRTTRQREEERNNNGTGTPRSIHYSPTLFEGNGERRSASPWTGEPPALQAGSGVSLPSLAALREFLRQHELEQDQQRYLPRRQASIVLGNDSASNSSNSRAPSSSRSALPAHARTAEALPLSDPWHTIEAAMAARAPSLAASASEIQNHRLRREHMLREARLLARYNDNVSLIRHAQHAHNPAWGLRSQGLAMGNDGRKLWVGSERGIFEYDMNLLGRMSWPAIQCR